MPMLFLALARYCLHIPLPTSLVHVVSTDSSNTVTEINCFDAQIQCCYWSADMICSYDYAVINAHNSFDAVLLQSFFANVYND
jgi:hypothetical protein